MNSLIKNVAMPVVVVAVWFLISGCKQSGHGTEQAAVSKNVMTLTEGNFKTEVLSSSQPVLVDFWATWCGPCKTIAPVVEELAEEFKGRAKFGKVDVDAQPGLAKQYNISAIPSLLYFKDGKPVDQVVGAQGKDALKARLEKAIGLAGEVAPSKK